MNTHTDFDFAFGRWHVQHQRLLYRLAGCDEWQHFSGSSQTWPLMNGHGNVEDNLIELPAGSYRAVALRSWNAATRQWAIWWLDGREPGALDVPVVGGFDAGVGRFLADGLFEGRPVRVRFEWTHTNTPTPRWEQALSDDGGLTWEVNWRMQFSRAA